MCAAVLVAGVVAGGLPGIADAAAKPGKRLILAPKPKQRLPARPVLIKVRAPRGAQHFKVGLNGHQIARHFSPPRHRVRRLRASLCYGLRHGHNLLRVRVGKRTQRLDFRVRRNRHLVCAGFPRTTSVGAKLRLTGRHRLPPRTHRPRRHRPPGWPAKRSAKGPGGGAKYKWKVISAPKPTETQPVVQPKSHGHEASWTPTLPGRYTLRLSVTTGARRTASGKVTGAGTTASDTTNITVLPNPQAPIVTMTHDDAGNWGVDVGSGTAVQFYADPGHSRQWVQLVALNARTLALVSNQSIDCPEATSNPYVTQLSAVQRCQTQLTNDLKALHASGQPPLVVIAVSQPPADGPPDYNLQAWRAQPPVGVLEDLSGPNGIGGPGPPIRWQETDVPMSRGNLSVIGYVGFNPGGATYHANLNLGDQVATGDIQGSLLADNQATPLFSAFVSPDQATFETQVPGSTATTNTMRVKGISYSESIGPGQGGFQLVKLHRDDLRPDGGSFFYETHTNIATARQNLTTMANDIDSLSQSGERRDIVLLTTVGNPQLPPYSDLNDAAKSFVDVLQNDLGASRSRVYTALDPALASNPSYTLIGVPGGTQPGQGLEALGTQTGSGLNGVPLSGYLDRSSSDYGYEVASDAVGDQLGSPGQKLHDLTVGVPIDDWPERAPGCKAVPGDIDPKALDNAGCVVAVNWIATRMLGDSNRGLFWTQPYTKEFWDAKKDAIAKCTYKGPSSSTCNFAGSASAADFQWAQSELEQEIGWLESVNGYVSTLAKPFADSLAMLSSDKDSIASRIDGLVQASASDQSEVKLNLFLNGLRDGAVALAGFIPGVGEAAESMNAALNTALEWGKVGAEGADAGGDFHVTAAEVGSTLANSLQAAQQTLQRQTVGVIAADYGKLKTLGICSQLDTSTCPDAGQWQLTQGDQTAAETLIRNSIRTSLFTALLPAKYKAWRMPISANRRTNWQGSQPAGQDITGWHCPFHSSPQSANFSYPVKADLGNAGGPNDQWQVIAYGQRTGGGSDLSDLYKMQVPDAGATDPLFQSVTNNGLGIGLTSAEPFYWQAFGNTGTSDFVHFPLQSSSTAWITSGTVGIKDANCGY